MSILKPEEVEILAYIDRRIDLMQHCIGAADNLVIPDYLKHIHAEAQDGNREELRILQNIKSRIFSKHLCDHKGYNFKQHGRCCPHCGKFLTDFGD